MSYPTIEDKIIDDGRISAWLASQMIATREVDPCKALEDVQKLKIILDRRVDRLVRERKTFKTQVDLNAIDF
jgi:hypothetical protein